MKPYLLSLAAGLLVGVIYSLLNVRSPAPPIVALVGLLGILIGEQLPPLARQLLTRSHTETSWLQQQVTPHMFGICPRHSAHRRRLMALRYRKTRGTTADRVACMHGDGAHAICCATRKLARHRCTDIHPNVGARRCQRPPQQHQHVDATARRMRAAAP